MKAYWTKQTTIIERIALSGPANTEREAKAELQAENYQIMYAGPYTNDELRNSRIGPKCDPFRFLILAERAIPEKPEPQPIEWPEDIETPV